MCLLFGLLVVDESTFAGFCISLLGDVSMFISQGAQVASFFLMNFSRGFFNSLAISAVGCEDFVGRYRCELRKQVSQSFI